MLNKMKLITAILKTTIKATVVGYKLSTQKGRKAYMKKKLGAVEKQILKWS